MLSVENVLSPLRRTASQRQAIEIYEAITAITPLPPIRERALQWSLHLLLHSWRMSDEALPAVLFFSLARETPTPWRVLGDDVVVPPPIADLVKDWHALYMLTAVARMDTVDAQSGRSLKLRRLMRQAYLNLPLVLLIIAEHYGRMITAVEKGTPTAISDPTLWAEARDIYIPLLASLGLWELRDSYISYAYQRFQPDEFEHANDRLKQAQKWHQEVFEEVRNKLRNQPDPEFNFLTRHHYTTAGKLLFTQQKTKRTIDEQLNRVVIDIITDKRAHCYRLLDLVHRLGSPHRRRFYDFIANPHLNGYQALQTRIEWARADKRAITLDFRIQTKRMNTLNDHGVIAAMYRFPDLYRGEETWWNTLRTNSDIQQILRERPVADQLPNAKRIYVFTPKGEVRVLRTGSTAVDFAYDLHTAVGHQCREIYINGVPATHGHGTRLQNGDLVDLKIDPTFNGPDPSWLRLARRPSTRRIIKAALHAPNASTSIGRQRLERYLHALEQESGLVIPAPRLENYLTQLAHELELGQASHVLDMLTRPQNRRRHKLTEERVISYILERELVGALLYPNGKPFIEVEGLHRETTYFRPLVRFCATCKPTPGAPLLLQRKQKRGREYLTLHRAAGTAVRYFGLPHGPETTCTKSLRLTSNNQIIRDLRWSDDTAVGHHLFNLMVVTIDRPGLIGDLLNPIYSDDGINLTGIHAQGDSEHTATIMLTVNCESWEKGHELEKAIQKLVPAARVTLYPLSAPQITAGHNRLPNPYSTGVPISSGHMFFGREQEIQQLRQALTEPEAARLIIMHGHRRTGKTSLAHHQREIWRGQPLLPIYVDLQNLAVQTPPTVYRAIALTTAETLETHQFDMSILPPTPSRKAFETSSDPYELLRTFLRQVTAVLAPRRLLIMLDEFNILLEERPHSPIFRQLRGATNDPVLTAVSLMPIMHTAQFNDKQRYDATSPARLLLEQGIELHVQRLDTQAARRLVEEPLHGQLIFDERVVNQIIHGTNSNPYLIHIICRALVEHLDRTRRQTVRQADLQHILDNHIYPAASRYFNFLCHHIAEYPSSLELTLEIAQAQRERDTWLTVDEIWQACRPRMPSYQFFQTSLHHLYLYGVVNLRGQTAPGVFEKVQIPVGFFRIWTANHPEELRALVEKRNT